jgi:hypothetical protein
MGAQQSKKFNDLTRGEVAEGIRALGSSFGTYAEAVLENGIDGSILSCLDEDKLSETLKDLGVSSRLHARVLTSKWETASSEKRSPPDEVAALIFTDIQGSTTLWESNPRAMRAAVNLHNKIMRRCIAKHQGYEVLTEGDAFHIAFHDAVDATSFALEVQQELQNAQWDDEILALLDAADDGKAFRGLRVRIAIHCGDVKSQDNKVSGRREYCGQTYTYNQITRAHVARWASVGDSRCLECRVVSVRLQARFAASHRPRNVRSLDKQASERTFFGQASLGRKL